MPLARCPRSIRPLLPAIALILLAAAPAAAASGAWTPIGPDGGSVFALAIDSRAGSLYAGTRAGVFKSTDGGATWAETSGDLPGLRGPAQGTWVPALAVEADRADTIYASVLLDGVFKSTDGGASWQEAKSGLIGAHADILLAHPQVAGTLHAVTSAGIFKTTDGGGHWTQLPAFPTTVASTSVNALAVHPVSPQTLFAGAGDALLKTVNGGATWTHVATSAFGGWYIDALAIHPASPGTVYVAAGNFADGLAGVWRSTDGGATWTSASQGLPAGRRITAFAIPPAAPQALYAGVLGAGVFKSTDGGAHWVEASDALTTVAPRGLVPDPAAGATLYAAGEGLGTVGVFKSVDGGGSWAPRSRGIRAFWLEALVIDPRTPSTLYVASSRGVLKSTDGGQSWQPINQGLTDAAFVQALAIDPLDPRVLYAASTASQRLFKTVDGGLHWAPIADPVGGVRVLDIDPQQSGVLHAAGYLDGLFRSSDGGATWDEVGGDAAYDLHYLAVTDIERDPSSSAVLYAGTVYTGWPEGYVEPGLFKSADRGATWTRIADGHFFTLAIDPKAPSTLYTASGNTILKSTDGGVHWVPVGTAPTYGTTLLVDRIVSTTLYLASDYSSDAGVFRSDDGGATWSAWSEGLQHLAVSALALDPSTPGKLYVATRGGGLSTRLAATPGPCVPGPTEFCLAGGRFRVQVSWRTLDGATGPGRTLPLTGDTGAFWFFGDGNLELTVKVLDGRGLNGRFWVFYGSLTNVEFTLVVTDTVTGQQKTYRNPQGTMASHGDTGAF